MTRRGAALLFLLQGHRVSGLTRRQLEATTGWALNHQLPHLREHGLVEFLRDGSRYRLTPKGADLAHRLPPSMAARPTVVPVVREGRAA